MAIQKQKRELTKLEREDKNAKRNKQQKMSLPENRLR